MYKRPAVSVASGEQLLPGGEIVAGLAVVHFHVGSDVFVAKADIHGQVRAQLEVVLKKVAHADAAVTPADRDRLAHIDWEAEQKIGHARSGVGRPDLLCVCSAEGERPPQAVVRSVETVLLVAQNLAAGLENMPAASDRQAVGVLECGGRGDAVAAARTDGGDIGNGEQRQTGSGTVGSGNAEFFAEVADIPGVARQRRSPGAIDADSRFVQERTARRCDSSSRRHCGAL